jgi:hypothetical protein
MLPSSLKGSSSSFLSLHLLFLSSEFVTNLPITAFFLLLSLQAKFYSIPFQSYSHIDLALFRVVFKSLIISSTYANDLITPLTSEHTLVLVTAPTATKTLFSLLWLAAYPSVKTIYLLFNEFSLKMNRFCEDKIVYKRAICFVTK